MKILGIKIPEKKIIDEEAFVKAAEACGFNKMLGLNLRKALIAYAGDESKLTQKFLCKIPNNKIEEIKGIKAAGHTVISYLKSK